MSSAADRSLAVKSPLRVPSARVKPARVKPPRVPPARWAVGLLGALLVLSGCASGSLSSTETSSSASIVAVPPTSRIAGPTVIVTVPDLVPTESAPPAAPTPAASAPAATTVPPPAADPVAPTSNAVPTEDAETPIAEPTAEATTAQAAPPVDPAAPTGEGLNVSLANCDGCTVLATHRGVTGELSAALVATESGRAILLSVGGDGQVSGVIGVPYGAAFSAPDGGVLACAQGRCVVQGRQSDGRAVLSAFELTDTGAWRDVSGDDAFPSATERAAVIDLDGELGIAVQDQADGAAVWMLYTWGGDRYAVAGCAADGPAPTSAAQVSPGLCLS